MAWEHALLGDVGPARIGAAAGGDRGPVEEYRGLLAVLGPAPRAVDEEWLRAAQPELDLVRLPGSGLVVTLGELNVLPDYLGRPEEIEAAPLPFIGPLIQSVRSWSVAELRRSAGHRSAARAGAAAARVAALPAARAPRGERRDRGGQRARQAAGVRAAKPVRLGPGA